MASAPIQPPVADGSRCSDYLDRLMRRESFAALWPLFARAPKPAKELTESFSALEHLRPLFPARGPFRVLHVGDGAHARTAALFALKTEAENISIDPSLNEGVVSRWREQFGIERFAWRRAPIEAVAQELDALPSMPVFVTFVHAHVSVDETLARLRWQVAFSLECCQPGHQRTARHHVLDEGEDGAVLSSGHRFQVLRSVAPSLR